MLQQGMNLVRLTESGTRAIGSGGEDFSRNVNRDTVHLLSEHHLTICNMTRLSESYCRNSISITLYCA